MEVYRGLGSGGFSQPAFIEPEEGGPEGQLYNMRADPSEKDNLYLQNPEKLLKLKGILEEVRD
jgi:arylsulfatase A